MYYVAVIAIYFFDKTNLINEILQLREEIRSIALDETLDDDRKMYLIYRLMPTTKRKESFLFYGDNKRLLDKEDRIGEWDPDASFNSRLIYDAPEHVPPYAIIEKFTEIIRDNPLDVDSIINATNSWGDRPQWPVFDYYIDSDLFPPKSMRKSGQMNFNVF